MFFHTADAKHANSVQLLSAFPPLKLTLLQTTFFKVGCDKVVARNDNTLDYMTKDETEKSSIADPTTEITATNVMLYLGVLTLRTNEVLQGYSQLLHGMVAQNKRRRAEQAAAAAAAAAMGSPLKVKREREFRPSFPSVGPHTKEAAAASYETISTRIPSLKDTDDELTEEEVNRVLQENQRALVIDAATSFTDSFKSRVPRKASPKGDRRK